MFCETCGSALSEGARFCKACGAQAQASPDLHATPLRPPVRLRGRRVLWSLVALGIVIIGLAAGLGGYYGTRSDEASDSGDQTAGDGPPHTAQGDAEDEAVTAAGLDPHSGGVLRVMLHEPLSIDPLRCGESSGGEVLSAVFDSLAEFDYRTGRLLPAAAASWKCNEDATVWTFRLARGATFHDGSPVTAADFKYAWERLCNPVNLSPNAYLLAPVKGFDQMQQGTATDLMGVEAVDRRTLRVTLSYPFADFEYVVGHAALAPVPKALVQADPVAFAEQPVGNGPFAMAEPWAHDQYIRLTTYDDYYGDRPHLDEVQFRIYESVGDAWKDFQAGDLDFTAVELEKLAEAEATYGRSPDGITVSPGEQVVTGPEIVVHYLTIDNSEGALADPLVRRALSLAIDREALSDAGYAGRWLPATNVVPPGAAGRENDAWRYCVYDPAAAKATLAAAGYPNGRGLPPIKLNYSLSWANGTLVREIQAYWEAIGVDVSLEDLEWDVLLARERSGDYMVGTAAWGADYPTMDAFLTPLFAIGSRDNMSRFSDAAIDNMLKQARTRIDDTERTAMYQAVSRAIGDASPIIPLLYASHFHVGSERVRDLVYSVYGQLNLEEVWIAGD